MSCCPANVSTMLHALQGAGCLDRDRDWGPTKLITDKWPAFKGRGDKHPSTKISYIQCYPTSVTVQTTQRVRGNLFTLHSLQMPPVESIHLMEDSWSAFSWCFKQGGNRICHDAYPSSVGSRVAVKLFLFLEAKFNQIGLQHTNFGPLSPVARRRML